MLRARWVEGIGWLGFAGLLAALLSGHPIFDPFVFGFAYYIAVVFRRSLVDDGISSTVKLRLLCISAIAMLYLFFHLGSNVNKHSFERRVERTCDREPGSERICEQIRSDIEDYLNRPLFPSSDE